METVISAQPVKLQRDKFQRAMCKKIDNMDKWKSRHLIAFLAIGRTRFFPSCEKLIPSKTLKLSAAVHLSPAEILILSRATRAYSLIAGESSVISYFFQFSINLLLLLLFKKTEK